VRRKLLFVRAGAGGTLEQVSEALNRVAGRPVVLGEVRERKGPRGTCFTVMLQDESVVGDVLRGKTMLKGSPIFLDRFKSREERMARVSPVAPLMGQRDWSGRARVAQGGAPGWSGRPPFLAYRWPLPGWG
jgi:hypothetical protein